MCTYAYISFNRFLPFNRWSCQKILLKLKPHSWIPTSTQDPSFPHCPWLSPTGWLLCLQQCRRIFTTRLAVSSSITPCHWKCQQWHFHHWQEHTQVLWKMISLEDFNQNILRSGFENSSYWHFKGRILNITEVWSPWPTDWTNKQRMMKTKAQKER